MSPDQELIQKFHNSDVSIVSSVLERDHNCVFYSRVSLSDGTSYLLSDAEMYFVEEYLLNRMARLDAIKRRLTKKQEEINRDLAAWNEKETRQQEDDGVDS